MHESPYSVPGAQETIEMEAQRRADELATQKYVRPDGSREPEQSVAPEAMREFLDKATAIGKAIEEHGVTSFRELNTQTGTITAAETAEAAITTAPNVQEPQNEMPKWQPPSDPADIRALFDKCARFLDPHTKGPRTLITVRHKVFAVKLPVAQAMLDASQIVGVKVGAVMTEAEAAYYHVQVLRQAVMGWLPESNPAVAVLRENIDRDEKEWPKLQPINWLSTRDPYWYTEEVGPLYIEFMRWRALVEPTPEEFDFYFSRVI